MLGIMAISLASESTGEANTAPAAGSPRCSRSEKAGASLGSQGDAALFGVVCLVHFIVGALYRELGGITIEPGPSFDWNASWHLMPLDLLRGHLLKTLWYLHAQPPIHNFLCGIFIKLFYPGHIACMHYPQIVLGALISGMTYVILRRFIGRRRPAFIVALLLSLNPSLFLFEAQVAYDLLAAFWVTLSVFFLALFDTRKRLAYAGCFVLSLNALILTRSLFHPILLLAAIPIACVAAGGKWRPVLAAALIISLSSTGWYLKNYLLFDTFAGSSWGGQNLWTHVSANYDRKDLDQFIGAGVIDRTVLDVLVWHRPDAYRAYGFNAHSDIDALSRNNFNNINIVAISKMYLRNALRLMRHRPGHYLVNVAKAYRIFCLPTSRTDYVLENAARMGLHESFVSQILQGQFYTGCLAPWFGNKDPFLSFWFFVLPATFAGYAVYVSRRCGKSLDAWSEYLQTDAVMALAAVIILYTIIVGCTCDYGENGRFKFAVEPVLWPFVVGTAYRIFGRAP
jgi:hypothetical protein